jgi:16S rRNA (cytosine1402-N4)-methyltransferase
MTAGRDDGQPDVAGGLARHIPVLLRPVLQFLDPKPDATVIDGTFGAGGYTRALLARGARVIGIDRDPSAIAAAGDLVASSAGRLRLAQATFSQLDGVADELVDGVVLDLGVSSMQLDIAARGFSFRLEGALDMRMSSEGASASDVVARTSERDLAAIIATLGEERHARAVARAIVRARAEAPVTTTRQLAEIVARVVHTKPGDIHPATRTFQALRLFVNDELSELANGLMAAERILKPGGRLVVVSFHSLEDRIVKQFLAARAGSRAGSRHLPETRGAPASFDILTKRPIGPDDSEVADNPRARSAKLRAAARTDAPAHREIASALPPLPSLRDVMRGR